MLCATTSASSWATTSVTDAASGEQLEWNATDEGIRVEVGGPADRPVQHAGRTGGRERAELP